ncbi:MAG: zinc-ribbon domain-containing protein [Anaerolineae bacterium]|nr:zinc-ribbon domain-containing protein [Gemmatimonadaceae bacterium]
MNVSCPDCASIFRVDPAKVPEAGVRARCSVCGAVMAIGKHGLIDDDYALVVADTRRSAQSAQARPAPTPPRAVPSVSRQTPPGSLPSPAQAAGQRTTSSPPRGAPVTPPPTPVAARPTTPARPFPQAAAAPPVSSIEQRASTGAEQPVVAMQRSHTSSNQPPASVKSPGSSAPASATKTPLSPATHSSPPPARTPNLPPTQPVSTVGSPSMAQKGSASAAASPAAPPAARRPINPFLTSDPNQKAKRLARALVSDIVAYFPDKRKDGLQNGTLKALFREEIKRSHEEYVDQVGRDFAESTSHFRDALNEVLAGGSQVF